MTVPIPMAMERQKEYRRAKARYRAAEMKRLAAEMRSMSRAARARAWSYVYGMAFKMKDYSPYQRKITCTCLVCQGIGKRSKRDWMWIRDRIHLHIKGRQGLSQILQEQGWVLAIQNIILWRKNS